MSTKSRHRYRPDGSYREISRLDVVQLLQDLDERDDPAARFLKEMSDAELGRYAANIADPRPELEEPSPPDLSRATADEVGEWLEAIWRREELGVEDPACPTMPLDGWISHLAEDNFYRGHIHARFYKSVTQLDLGLADGPA